MEYENETTAPTEGMDSVPLESVATEVQTVTVADVHQAVTDLAHADLFGSFLICGTLVGCTLFRRFCR